MNALVTLATLAGMVGIVYGGDRLLLHIFGRHQMDVIRPILVIIGLLIGGCHQLSQY
jgi:hypothetical protein